MLGDKASDLEAAAAAGVRGVAYRGGNAHDLVAGLIA
jgi:phosphoglycolate phosphatase-like HAD superfamily hydrolase